MFSVIHHCVVVSMLKNVQAKSGIATAANLMVKLKIQMLKRGRASEAISVLASKNVGGYSEF